MKHVFPLVITALLLAATTTHAQERSAGQAYDAQTNWNALNGRINAVVNQNKLLASALDKINACNAKKMLYTPTDKAADANGCVAIPTSLKWVGTCQTGNRDSHKVGGPCKCNKGETLMFLSVVDTQGDDEAARCAIYRQNTPQVYGSSDYDYTSCSFDCFKDGNN